MGKAIARRAREFEHGTYTVTRRAKAYPSRTRKPRSGLSERTGAHERLPSCAASTYSGRCAACVRGLDVSVLLVQAHVCALVRKIDPVAEKGSLA